MNTNPNRQPDFPELERDVRLRTDILLAQLNVLMNDIRDAHIEMTNALLAVVTGLDHARKTSEVEDVRLLAVRALRRQRNYDAPTDK